MEKFSDFKLGQLVNQGAMEFLYRTTTSATGLPVDNFSTALDKYVEKYQTSRRTSL